MDIEPPLEAEIDRHDFGFSVEIYTRLDIYGRGCLGHRTVTRDMSHVADYFGNRYLLDWDMMLATLLL